MTEHNEEDDCYIFMATNKESNLNKVDWYIDSTASPHFTNKKDWCIDFIENKTGSDSVSFGGGKEYEIARKGNVQIEMQCKRLFFLNVFFVPGLGKNLLSISKIMKHNPHLNVIFNREGIQRQCTAPYTPQQNGVVGRQNRTIMEMTRCMLMNKSILNKYWAKIVNTVSNC